MQCGNCKKEVATGSVFCNHCGAKIEPIKNICPNKDCGRTGLPEDAVFCPDCGLKLLDWSKTIEVYQNETIGRTEKKTISNSVTNNEEKRREINWGLLFFGIILILIDFFALSSNSIPQGLYIVFLILGVIFIFNSFGSD